MELIILESMDIFMINWSLFLWSMVVPQIHLQAPCLLIQDVLIPSTPTTFQVNFCNDEGKIICLFCDLCAIVSNLVYILLTT
jgi:hypothetical protein